MTEALDTTSLAASWCFTSAALAESAEHHPRADEGRAGSGQGEGPEYGRSPKLNARKRAMAVSSTGERSTRSAKSARWWAFPSRLCMLM